MTNEWYCPYCSRDHHPTTFATVRALIEHLWHHPINYVLDAEAMVPVER